MNSTFLLDYTFLIGRNLIQFSVFGPACRVLFCMRLVLRFIVLGILLSVFLIFIGIKYLASGKTVQELEDDAALHLLESFPDDSQASEGIQARSERPPLSINIAVILIISLLTVALLITGIYCQSTFLFLCFELEALSFPLMIFRITNSQF